MTNLKEQLWSEIDVRRDELVELCAEAVRVASPNPPGDTTAIADFVQAYLSSSSYAVERVEPKPGAPNLIASLDGGGEGPHLVFNSHLDTFPVADGEWSQPPFGGVVKDGRIFGCGATDMKAGLAISLFVANLMTGSPNISGRLTFSYSSDEETGGRWGTEWLLAHLDSIRGDVCVIGDQSGATKLAVGEKGMCWLRLSCEGKSSHAAYGSSSESATRMLIDALPILYSLEDMTTTEGPLPLGDPISRSVTVNVGRLEGGVSPNLVADRATADADIRIPHGLSVDVIVGQLRHRLDQAGTPCEIEVSRSTDPTVTDTSSKLVKVALDNGREVLGEPPEPVIRLGASDARFFRQAGIPTVVYGPEAHNMGAPDEYVDVEELLQVARVHAGIAVDFVRAGRR